MTRGSMALRDYSILMKLGEGGVGDVYLAEARGSGDFRKLVVIKCLKPGMLGQAGMHESFLAEARMCARLNHPNIVQVLSVMDDGGVPLMTMEYLEGQALVRLLRDNGGDCPLTLKLHAIAEVLEGLTYFHCLEDVDGSPLRPVHRDISPQNVVITYEGTVKILDFGIAKSSARTSENHTEAGVLKGKIQYMPREQILDDAVDARVDLYAVGIMLWEAIARRRVWQGQTDGQIVSAVVAGEHPTLPPEVHAACTPALRDVVTKALASDREQRFASAKEMRAALMSAMDAIDPSPQGPRLRAYLQDHYAGERSTQLRRIREARLAPHDTMGTPPRSGSAEESTTARVSPQTPVTRRPPKGAGRRTWLAPLVVAAIVGSAATSAWMAARARPLLPAKQRPHAIDPVAPVTRDSSGASAGEPVPTPCGPALADFEDGWAHLCAAPGRSGRVIVYSDGTGLLTPPVGLFGAADVLPEPRGESKHALHWTARQVTDWGAGLVVPFDAGKAVDLGAMQGVEIWMRAEKNPVNVLIEMATTDTLGVSFGGSCQRSGAAICDDHYSASRTVSVFWTLVRVRFQQLHQLGFGVPAEWNPSRAVELHVAVKRDSLPKDDRERPMDFELWVDDVSFY